MYRRLWIWLFIFLVLVAAFVVSGCSIQLKWFGAGGVDCEWDDIDYKHLQDAQESGEDDFRRDIEQKMRKAEERQKELEFGPCTGNDLINRTCD